MLKPFGVKKTDWEEFNKTLFDKMCELQKQGNTIKDVKYSSELLRPEYSKNIGNPYVEYSAIILYDDNEG